MSNKIQSFRQNNTCNYLRADFCLSNFGLLAKSHRAVKLYKLQLWKIERIYREHHPRILTRLAENVSKKFSFFFLSCSLCKSYVKWNWLLEVFWLIKASSLSLLNVWNFTDENSIKLYSQTTLETEVKLFCMFFNQFRSVSELKDGYQRYEINSLVFLLLINWKFLSFRKLSQF